MFSVVIPLYNKERSILQTVSSVLKQSTTDFELIVVDDGSTDNSVCTLKEIDDSRFRIIGQTNQGVSVARNRGIAEANFQWIAFLDADDIWREDHLAEFGEMMKIFPNERVFATSFEYSDKRFIPRIKRANRITLVDQYFKDALIECLIWSSCVVVHKSCFENVGGFDGRLTHGEDIDMWSRLARNYGVVKSAKITAIYRAEAENRAGFAKDCRSSVAFHIDLAAAKDTFEYEYYKKNIIERMVAYLRRRDIKNFKRLKVRHPLITYNAIVVYLIKRIGS